MEFSVIDQEHGKRVKLTGQLTFADNQKFRQLIALLDNNTLRSIELDFAGIDFIDSAGLGMLLLFRDKCQTNHISVSICSARGQVEKIFIISKFDQLFSMQP